MKLNKKVALIATALLAVAPITSSVVPSSTTQTVFAATHSTKHEKSKKSKKNLGYVVEAKFDNSNFSTHYRVRKIYKIGHYYGNRVYFFKKMQTTVQL